MLIRAPFDRIKTQAISGILYYTLIACALRKLDTSPFQKILTQKQIAFGFFYEGGWLGAGKNPHPHAPLHQLHPSRITRPLTSRRRHPPLSGRNRPEGLRHTHRTPLAL